MGITSTATRNGVLLPALCAGVLAGCGGREGDGGIGGRDSGGSGLTGEGSVSGTASSGSASDSSGEGTSESGATEGTGDSATGGGSTGGSSDGMSSGGSSATDGTGGIPRFDVGSDEDPGDPSETCDCGMRDFSYLWVANSPEGTVSKINTRTLQEDGRYFTRPTAGARPQADGSPSRTSVSVDGKAVVVANRHVGIVKIWSRPDFCEDKNGNGTIETSSAGNEVLPFEEDECIAWYRDFPDMTVQRPVQWTPGVWDEQSCEFLDQKVWTIAAAGGPTGFCGSDGAWVYRLNGDTGEIEDEFHIPDSELPCQATRGPYGAAVDREGNLWFQKWHSTKKLVRVDNATLDYEVFDFGVTGYGITVDALDRVWLSGTMRFDSVTGDLQTNGVAGGQTGLGLDPQRDRIWASDKQGVLWIDPDTLQEGGRIPWPDGNPDDRAPRGVSVDVDGFLWGVRMSDDRAFKFDVENGTTWVVPGLVGAYTYSDMTGGQIATVGGCVIPPG